MDEHRARALLEKYIAGKCSDEERTRVEKWYDDFRRPEERGLSAEDAAAQLARIRLHLVQQTSETEADIRGRRRIYWKYAGATVAAILLIAMVFTFYVLRNPSISEDQLTQRPMTVQPGRDRAILILADGQRLDLEQAAIGTLVENSGMRIEKSADGALHYIHLSGADPSATIHNRIETPRGGQFQIGLPDGTQVWLNAESSLEYWIAGQPDGERRVTLHGEAYFEVSPMEGIPFVVESEYQEIDVLGTHFNVYAYREEAITKTTLVEGSVRIRRRKHGLQQHEAPVYLRPGQQGQVARNGTMQVVDADVTEAAAWKDGYFLFDHEPIEPLMRRIARWYDVDVHFEGINTQQVFSGTISRYDQLDQVLEKLELTGGVQFRIEPAPRGRGERRIVVMP